MENTMTGKTVISFLDELASNAPAPGGGSVAALSGALGAGLISMVCNLTLGKPKYAEVQDKIAVILKKSESLRQELTGLLEADVEAYSELNRTMKMPKDTEEQKAIRAKAMDKALKAATEVPLRVAEACVTVMILCTPTADIGIANAVSDIGVAVLAAEAGLRSAALNVLINIGLIKDEKYVSETRGKLDSLLTGKATMREQIYQLVTSKLTKN